MASGITLKSTNDSIVNIKNVGTTTGTTEVTVPNRNMTMGTEITLGTAQATTSGTFKDFTIPSEVKRVTVMFDGVSTNGTSTVIIQLGNSGGVETTGYTCNASGLSSIVGTTSYTTGFGISDNTAIVAAHSGSFDINKIYSNSFTIKGATDFYAAGGGAKISLCVGSKTLSAELTTVRITTVNGTDLFDAGIVNVSWEF